jgi:Ca2+-transporting ATPase
LYKPFANKWLNNAILWDLALLLLVIYVPFLHDAFGVYYLPLVDWWVTIGLAFTIVPVLELAKWMMRRGWFGNVDD